MIRYYNEFKREWLPCSLYNSKEYLNVISKEGDTITSIYLKDYNINIKVNCYTYYFNLNNKIDNGFNTQHLFDVSNKYILDYWINILSPLTTFSPSEFLSTKRYNITNKIGSGSFGKVFKALDIKSNNIVAIKEIKDIFINMIKIKNIINELRILSCLHHVNVISFKDVYIEKHAIYIVTELCKMDLLQLIRNNTLHNSLEFINVVSITYQCLDALDYIHNYDIIHRDIKPSNILLQGNVVKLCDFGMARFLYDNSITTENVNLQSNIFCGLNESIDTNICYGLKRSIDTAYTNYVVTRWYRAPEVLLTEGKYGKEQDVWALGCTISELITTYPIIKGTSRMDQLYRIILLLGKPTQNDMNFITNKKIINQINNMINYKSTLHKILLDSHMFHSFKYNSFIYLIENMLIFHPHYRISAKQALHLHLFHNFHHKINKNEVNKLIVQNNPFPIKLVHQVDNNIMKQINLLYKEIEYIRFKNSSHLLREIISTNSHEFVNCNDSTGNSSGNTSHDDSIIGTTGQDSYLELNEIKESTK